MPGPLPALPGGAAGGPAGKAPRPLLDSCGAPEGDPGRERVRAVRLIAPDEPFFSGHFPELPVVPGVFLVELLAECGRRIAGAAPEGGERAWRIVEVGPVRFRRRVSPGDRLHLEVERAGGAADRPSFAARALVEGRLVTEAGFTLG